MSGRGFARTIGVVALLLGAVIVLRGVLDHASLLYDLVGVLFLGLGAARLREAGRGRR